MIYEGKSKIVTNSSEEGLVNIYFKNDVTAFNGEKHDVIKDKGLVNCYISAFFMKMFERNYIPTHFIEMTDDQTYKCIEVDIIPVVPGLDIPRDSSHVSTRHSRHFS